MRLVIGLAGIVDTKQVCYAQGGLSQKFHCIKKMILVNIWTDKFIQYCNQYPRNDDNDNMFEMIQSVPDCYIIHAVTPCKAEQKSTNNS